MEKSISHKSRVAQLGSRWRIGHHLANCISSVSLFISLPKRVYCYDYKMPVSTQSPDRQRPLDDDKVTGVSIQARLHRIDHTNSSTTLSSLLRS